MTVFEFDVALSFSGAQRKYVAEVAGNLAEWGPRIFFDADNAVEMWGEDLNEYLQSVYGQRSRFIVMFVSAEYASTAFPTAERRAAFEAAMHGKSSVLPVRFDETAIPGLGRNVSYLDARELAPGDLATSIARKLELAGVSVRRPTRGTSTLIPRRGTTSRVTVTVTDQVGGALDGCQVALVAANGNVVRAIAAGSGQYEAAVPSGRIMDLWVAHAERPAFEACGIDTASDVEATVGTSAGAGSSVFFGSTGYIPPIGGRLEPIFDPPHRYYVYIDNAAVNGSPARPAHFQPGVPFEVEDCDGSITVVTIVAATGNGSLIQWVVDRS